MPVPINATNFKLDSIIGIAVAEVGTDEAGDPYTVRRPRGTEESDLGPLELDWSAVPIGGDVGRWFLYVRTEAQDLAGSGFFSPLYGVFPVEADLEIADTPCSIDSFEIPAPTNGNRARVAGLSGVRDLPILQADGDAEFRNGYIGGNEPFDLVQFSLTLGVGVRVYSGVIVNVTPDSAFPAGTNLINASSPAQAHVGITASGGINLQLGGVRAVWAQEFDRTISSLDAPDGVEAQESVLEEVRTWIVREEVSASSVVLVDNLRFGISEVKPLDRGRHWSVTGSRRYAGVTL